MSNCCGTKPEPKVTSSSCDTPKPEITSSCCAPAKPLVENTAGSCCGGDAGAKPKRDWLLLGGASIVVLGYLVHFASLQYTHDAPALPEWLAVMSDGIFSMVNQMWWGIIAAILFVGLLERIPRELIMSALGQGGTVKGIFRATLAGVLLDLCSHGILMVGTKLYERGASLGQLMAFLIASPWNSLSLTIIMMSLIGIGWTVSFILLSMLIGIVSGIIFDSLVKRGVLPESQYRQGMDLGTPATDVPKVKVVAGLIELMRNADYSPASLLRLVTDGVKDSKMVFRWLFFGIVLATGIRAFVPMDTYQTLFGPTMLGLALTLVAATIIEVCSEGSTPIASDLVTRAAAPGNGFGFLMAGIATDYTEIMVLKDTTGSWKIALFLPLITLPQVLAIGFILNNLA